MKMTYVELEQLVEQITQEMQQLRDDNRKLKNKPQVCECCKWYHEESLTCCNQESTHYHADYFIDRYSTACILGEPKEKEIKRIKDEAANVKL